MRDMAVVSIPAAAAVFVSGPGSRVVQTLIGTELTLAELARQIELPISLAHYHLSKCIRLGLVKIVRQRARAGRAVKYYRAAAKTFFVPTELLSELPGAAMARQLGAALDRSIVKSLRGVEYSHDGRNARVRLVKDAAARAASIEVWLDAGLSAQDAATLIAELEALAARFGARAKPGQPRYLLHLAAARV